MGSDSASLGADRIDRIVVMNDGISTCAFIAHLHQQYRPEPPPPHAAPSTIHWSRAEHAEALVSNEVSRVVRIRMQFRALTERIRAHIRTRDFRKEELARA